jgi:hypothetical protein
VGLELNVFEGLEKIKVTISALEKKILPTAIRRSLKDSAKFMQARSIEEIVKVRKIAKGKLKANSFRTQEFLRGPNWTNFAIIFKVLSKPLPLIDFVKGSKKPRKQKGKKSQGGKYPSRSRIGVEIVPGMPSKPEGIFIAKGKSDKMAVFRRHPKSKSKGRRRQRSDPRIVTQNIPSIHNFFKDQRWVKPILDKTARYMPGAFIRAMNVLLKRI